MWAFTPTSVYLVDSKPGTTDIGYYYQLVLFIIFFL